VPPFFKYGFYLTVFITLLLLFRKKKKLPTKLDLSGFKRRSDGKSLGGVRKVQAEVIDDESEFKDSVAADLFLYKGKKYNAWQALGVPAGAGLDEVKKAFAVKSNQDALNKDFYFKAMKTLV